MARTAIVGSINALTSAALKYRAKQLLYETIESDPRGQLFAVRVAPEERPTKILPRQFLEQLEPCHQHCRMSSIFIVRISPIS